MRLLWNWFDHMGTGHSWCILGILSPDNEALFVKVYNLGGAGCNHRYRMLFAVLLEQKNFVRIPISHRRRVCKLLYAGFQPKKKFGCFYLFFSYFQLNCHLFNVDTVSTEAGVTELAIVTRLDETSALVAALHLLHCKIKSNQTKHYQKGTLFS